MPSKKPLVLENGKPSQLNRDDDLREIDFHSGVRRIEVGERYCIRQNKEMRVRRVLKNFGVLKTKGLLIMD